jgi:SAM-dependent methyltransferase
VADYQDWFFELQTRESREAAAVVAPLLLDLTPAESVLDVGGGVGAWAAGFHDAGVPDVLCVDGDYVDQAKLLVEPERFVAHDLTQPLDVNRRFDLCVCLEVGEHLPASSAATLVETVTRHSDVIAFSAAVPRQGGEHHINEQWPSYWRPMFKARGYRLLDIIRPRIWDDDRVGFWFRQNMLVYATGEAAKRLSDLPPVAGPLDVIHPEAWTRRTTPRDLSIRESARGLQAAIGRRFRSS